MPALHPDEVLTATGAAAGALPVCEHYAGNEKKLAKALALQQSRHGDFDVTIDLEDGAVAGQEKETVAAQVALVNQFFSDPANHVRRPDGSACRFGCRVHPFDHPSFADDVHALAHGLQYPLAYLTLPKPAHLAEAKQAIAHAAQVFQSAGKPLPPIQVMIETHGALRDVFALAELPEVHMISFGQMDFTSAHNGAIPASAMRSPGQFDHVLMRRAKVELSAACHAASITPTHGPTVDYNDVEQTRSDAQRAKDFGFLRMWSIHPAQIEPIVSVFAPGQDEIEEAANLLLAAQAADWGPIAFGGKLHDRASYRYFWSLLKKAHNMNRSIPAQATESFFNHL
jgi:citrate lyase subunit beta/citryl-CoA lyase